MNETASDTLLKPSDEIYTVEMTDDDGSQQTEARLIKDGKLHLKTDDSGPTLVFTR